MRRYKRIVIIAEKPKAAEKIAYILDKNGSLRELSYRGIKYYKLKFDKSIIYVVYGLGHIYVLEEPKPKYFKRYPIFALEWKLNTKQGSRRSSVKKIVSLINKLTSEADEIVNACDYDIEGSTLGYNIIRFSKKKNGVNISRMKFSSLTRREILESFLNRDIKLDGNYPIAGITRHLIDFIWGVNLTRLLTDLTVSVSGVHSLISIGRVQGPTLYYIVKREREINTFVPLPFWELHIRLKTHKGQIIEASYEKNPVETKNEVDKLKNIIGSVKEGKVKEIKKGKRSYKPPPPFNLTDLQSEAYTNFGFSPSKTLSIAEQLYLEALITYPRTSSQKYPDEIDHKYILSGLMRNEKYRELSKKVFLVNKELKPKEGKKDDPAHPAIFPTGEKPERELSIDEKKIYDLIVRRYLSSFYPPIVMKTMKVFIDINNYTFITTGRSIVEYGWLETYSPYTSIGENTIPDLNVNETLKIIDLHIEDKYTRPPRRYTQRSLLLQMERDGIGTKATRSQIIDTLYHRNYIRGESIEPTELGMTLIEVLEKKVPTIISIDMTRDMEKNLEAILSYPDISKKVLYGSIETVSNIILSVWRDQKIGEELDSMSKKTRYKKRVLGECPICNDGEIYIVTSRKTKKRFAGCTNYPKCNAAMPLPQSGIIRTIGKCKKCGWPKIKVTIGRKTFISCVNLNCISRGDVKNG
jgi:DNA topoisomerase-1